MKDLTGRTAITTQLTEIENHLKRGDNSGARRLLEKADGIDEARIQELRRCLRIDPVALAIGVCVAGAIGLLWILSYP